MENQETHFFICVWNKSLSIMSRKACVRSKNETSEETNMYNVIFVNHWIIHTLCWANIRTLCWPTPMAPSELEPSTPMPHSSRISWRATNLGEWCSLWSSEIISEVAGNSSDKRSVNDSGTISPMTSNGWLQSFSKYWSAWNMVNNTNFRSWKTD